MQQKAAVPLMPESEGGEQMTGILRKINKFRFHNEMAKFARSEQMGKITHIQMEPTVRCNLNCITCTRSEVLANYSRMDMSLEELDKILSMLPDLKTVKLGGLGEPLFHPQLEEYFKRINDKKIRLWMNSNGTALFNPAIRKIVLKYVDDLVVSFDSTVKEKFEAIRLGSNFDLIKEGTKKLVEERNQNNAKTVIGINFVVTHLNYNEIESLYDLALELGLDYISVVEVENWLTESEDGYEPSRNFVSETRLVKDDINKKLRSLRIRLLTHGILLGHKTSKERLGNCYWPFNGFFVNLEGYVMPCNIRMHKSYTFGNIYEAEKIEDVLNNEQYINFRKCHIEGDKTNKICGNCPN